MYQMNAFKQESVLSDMNVELPRSLLKVTYSDGDIITGKAKAPTLVKDQPTLKWDADPNEFYTVLFNDLDVPSRATPSMREFHHWCVVNVPGCDVDKGDVLTEFVGSGPAQGSGLHRYVFLVYKQEGKISCDEKKLTNNSGAGRVKYSVAAFAQKYNLGNPVAGNFYQAEYDDYVPILYKQLGMG